MNQQNIKVYIGVSFALIILFILIIVVPFKKSSTSQSNPTPSFPTPTSIETGTNNSQQNIPSNFTGAVEETLPPAVVDAASKKKDLRQKVPLNMSTFTIDFDYSQDRFIVTLKDPKEAAQKEFESWRNSNYPAIPAEQFILK
jgi:hypothetical protein